MQYSLKLYTLISNNKLVITSYILIHTYNKNLKNNFLNNKSTTVNLSYYFIFNVSKIL